jgi:hypothetical protein
MGRNGTFTIYALINPLTGMAYVGQTSFHPYVRWAGGSGYRGKKDLAKDLKEIGWIHFKRLILEDNVLTQEKADEFEKYYIKKYSNENGVYNKDGGGSKGGKGYKSNKKTPTYQIDNNLNIIAEFDSISEAISKMIYDLEDAGEDISKYLNDKGILNPIRECVKNKRNKSFGYYWSKKSNYKPDWKPITHKRKVFQYDLNGNFIKEWDRPEQASKELNVSHSGISSVCNGKNKTAGGFIWKRNGNTDFSRNLEPKKTTAKKIFQYDLKGKFIKEWDSVSAASKALSIEATSICYSCSLKIKTAGGFIWKYPDDTDFSLNMLPDKTPAKKVFQYDLKGNFIKEWDSAEKASKSINRSLSNISSACTGRNKTAGGFIWKYPGDTDFSLNMLPDKTNEKKVIQYDLKGNLIKEWGSIQQASKALNIADSSMTAVCKGRLKTSGGFIWKYLGDNDLSLNLVPGKVKKAVIQYDLKRNFIKEWGSIREASKSLNICESSISMVCTGKYKTAGEFIWEYTESSDKVEEKVV